MIKSFLAVFLLTFYINNQELDGPFQSLRHIRKLMRMLKMEALYKCFYCLSFATSFFVAISEYILDLVPLNEVPINMLAYAGSAVLFHYIFTTAVELGYFIAMPVGDLDSTD